MEIAIPFLGQTHLFSHSIVKLFLMLLKYQVTQWLELLNLSLS